MICQNNMNGLSKLLYNKPSIPLYLCDKTKSLQTAYDSYQNKIKDPNHIIWSSEEKINSKLLIDNIIPDKNQRNSILCSKSVALTRPREIASSILEMVLTAGNLSSGSLIRCKSVNYNPSTLESKDEYQLVLSSC